MDTESESPFDAICNYACTFFQVSIAYIAFIDESRQWLKAACGMELGHVPRIGTFCARTILLDRVLVVENAAVDPRFQRNAYVVGAPHICFYAGAPLSLADGIRVGTLCLIDTMPKKFLPEEAAELRDLAELVVDCLQVRARQLAKGQLGTARSETPNAGIAPLS